MKMIIRQMNMKVAIQVSSWTYPGPYSIYNMDGSAECLNELLDGSYYAVTDEDNGLIGFCCFGASAQVPAGRPQGAYGNEGMTDVGLGMRPDLCGKGLGREFLQNALKFASNNLSAKTFRLTVAAFNERAIRVYESAGFQITGSFARKAEDRELEFKVMTLPFSPERA